MNPSRTPSGVRGPEATEAPLRPASRPTGIEWLDRELSPLPPIPHIVLAPDPGVDPTPFLLQTLAAHLAAGLQAVHVTARDEASLRHDFRRAGFDAAAHAAAVRTVDPASAAQAVRALGPTDLLVMDALPSATDGSRWTSEHRGPVLEVLSPSQAAATPKANAVVRLRRHDVQGARVEAFHVVRRAGGPASLRVVPYTVERPGGVRPHIAKVLVTGPHNAGKSSLVHTLSRRGVSVELLGTTVALDHGQVDRDGLLVELFGTPGQERFDPVIRQVAQGAQGVIVVVDSDKPSTFHRARDLAAATSGGRVPVVWAANKQDAPGAVSPTVLRQGLGLHPDARLMPCVATDLAQATRVLDALIALILAAPAEPAT